MSKMPDVVIEAVRYAGEKIDVARVFVRRGAAYGDHQIFRRDVLLDALKNNKKVVTGARREFLGGKFDLHKDVRLSGDWIVSGGQANRDLLEDTPIF
jgi:hypothetical protein